MPRRKGLDKGLLNFKNAIKGRDAKTTAAFGKQAQKLHFGQDDLFRFEDESTGSSNCLVQRKNRSRLPNLAVLNVQDLLPHDPEQLFQLDDDCEMIEELPADDEEIVTAVDTKQVETIYARVLKVAPQPCLLQAAVATRQQATRLVMDSLLLAQEGRCVVEQAAPGSLRIKLH